MAIRDLDRRFSSSMSEFYDRYMVPLIFEPYARDLAIRMAAKAPQRLLEIAGGTGVVTRALADTLPAGTAIVATDLNQSMLDTAALIGTKRPVEWRQADALQLPFGDETFDAVVCQFGAMFFPDRARAYSEARRVLRPGGTFLFNVWDRIEENQFADTITAALAALFPHDPPRFLARTPHGYFDRDTIARDLAAGGFAQPREFVSLAARSTAESPRIPAEAYCQGTPLRSEIERQGEDVLELATDTARQAIARKFGNGRVDGKIQAHVVCVAK